MNPASNPQINIPRSRFRLEFDHNTSFLHGRLIPLDCFMVMPGDDFSVHRSALEVIMSTPIAPIFGNIKAKVTAFFVPMRLLWDHTEEFFGANKSSSGPQTVTYLIPNRSLFVDGCNYDSVSHYLGKPIVAVDNTKITYGKVSVLKERGYWFIASEWYRLQQVQHPFIMNKTDTGLIGTWAGQAKSFNSLPYVVNKQYDLFTSAVLAPQYGNAVTLPLGTYAPVKTLDPDVSSNLISNLYPMHLGGTFGNAPGAGAYGLRMMQTSGAAVSSKLYPIYAAGDDTGLYSATIYPDNLWTDLSNATAAKINDIRYAFQLQKYLERCNYGTRFFEVLAVHYGVTSPDARLQRPEYLGGKTAPIVVRTVLSQAGYSASSSQQVGQPGASSITMIDLSGLFSKGFVEPGFVYVLLSTNHERLYSQGLLREDTLFDRFELYSPEFANLGDQAIKNKEIMLTGDSSDEQVFGYQGHWDEMRYRKKIVSGLLDPAATGSLDYWTLAEKFTARPSLSQSFLQENRDCLSRCLVTGATGPDYIADYFVEYAATREIPLYNIPGLVDHFGAL